MANVKIKVRPQETIKKMDKSKIGVERIKDNLVTTKEKLNELTSSESNSSAENYASNKVQDSMNYISRKGLQRGNEIRKKSLTETQENFIKGKQRISTLKNRIKNKKTGQLKNVVDNSSKTIKKGMKQSIKTSKNTKILAKKGIKTTEHIAKNSKKIAKESVKMTQRIARTSKQVIQTTVRATKAVVKATITAIKAIIAGTKAIVSAIIAGGWVAVVIILIIALIAGFVAVLFNDDEGSENSGIPSSEIVLVAKAQIGNEGGDKFWKWYGFNEHVEWCACFVSWCADQCGYISKGIIPKFSLCSDGVNWFKERNQWNDRGESYYPIAGDIIFFDWYEENGSQDGRCDHVGIVTRTDLTNRTIYTIEGNTNNKCAERMYSLDDAQVIGYGSPKY